MVPAEPQQARLVRVVVSDATGQEISAPAGEGRGADLVGQESDALLGAEVQLGGGGRYGLRHATHLGAWTGPGVTLCARRPPRTTSPPGGQTFGARFTTRNVVPWKQEWW